MPGFIKLRIAHKLSLLLFLFSAVAAGLTFLVCYQAASDQVMIDIQSRLRDIVSVSAQGVDMEDLARLKADPRIHTLPFRAVRQELARLRDATAEVKYTYVLVRDPDGTIRFLVDAEENPNDFIGPMRRYDDASAFLRARFDTLDGPVVENDFYTDEWGTWLSGYAPLHDADGHLTAVLGMDISATKVLAHRRNLRNRTLQLLGVALPIMLAVGLIVGRRAAAPIVAMKAGAERIGQGDLDLRLPVRSGDEVGVLSTALNRMASNLKANRARIEEIAASYRDIFDNAAEAIFQTTLQGRFITANIAAARMFGYETVEELLAGVNDLGGQLYVDAGDRRAFLDGLREAGRVDGLAVRFRRRDGDEIWAELSAHLTKTRSGESVIEGMALDVTARREREESERQCRAAEAASKAKSEFLANMSHEIRTPLNAVMGLTDLMLRTQMTDKQSQYLKKIKSSSQTLLAVINDILDFSKIEAGRLELEATQFSLYEVMANLSEMFSQKAHEKDLELLVSIADGLPNALVGDPVRLGQILINLVGNALKFTEKGEVVLAVEPAPKDEGRAALEQGKVMLEFSVRDTGIGIAADRVNSVFDSFTQEDSSTTRRFGGTGLGLSICKQLAGLMGGGIGVESEHGKGSRFHFTAVFGIQPESRQLRTQVPRDLRGLRVLVVDDNHTARDILEASIESFGMHADAVGSGLEALQKIGVADPPYDLILLDWKMPGLNGIETARGIKHDLKLTKTPIVCMISAYGREDLIQPTEKALLDAFLHKPVNQSFLFDTIMELFGRGDRVPLSGAGGGDEPPRPAACLAGVRVLLADDNEINREVAQEWLQTAGMVVSLVTNGREALEALGPGVLPDMVLMDIQMPEMDGLEATRRIRQDLGLVGLPVIAMTAHALKGDRERCLEAGMNDYVTKPIDPKQLFEVLARWAPERPEGAAPAAPEPAGPDETDEMAETPETAGTAPVPAPEPAPEPAPAVASAAPAAAGGLPPLPGIDLADGLFRANNNQRLYRKLLGSFLKDFSGAAAALQGQLAAGDVPSARRTAHSVKGVAGNIGAQHLSVTAAEVETELAEGRFEPGSPSWTAFAAALTEVVDGLAQAGLAPAAPAVEARAKVMSRPEAAERMDRLKTLLDDDLDAARTLAESLAPELRELCDPSLSEALVAHLESFELDEAAETADAIIAALRS